MNKSSRRKSSVRESAVGVKRSRKSRQSRLQTAMPNREKLPN